MFDFSFFSKFCERLPELTTPGQQKTTSRIRFQVFLIIGSLVPESFSQHKCNREKMYSYNLSKSQNIQWSCRL